MARLVTTIVGIDPSLRRTGIAALAANQHTIVAETWTHPTTGHHRDLIAARANRISAIARDVTDAATGADLVVVEGPSYGSQVSPGTWDRAGLWWLIVGRLVKRGTPVALVAPKTRAKWATGNGNAGKRDVHAAMLDLWP